MPRGPLSGYVVADFSHGVAGPFCTTYLADLGAEVIKIERPRRGDGARYMSVSATFKDGIPTDGGDYFLSINRNKKSVAIDLKHETGQRLALDLARDADVVVENFSRGVMKRLGLDYDSVKEHNRALVYCSLRAYGEEGPLADEVGMDVAIQARAGTMSVTGYPGMPPVKPGSSLADLAGGLNAALGVISALLHRERTGEGQSIDISLLDATAMMLVNYSVPVLAGGAEIAPMGSGHPQLVPFQAFRTADGWIVIAAGTNERWVRLCQSLARPELAEDPRFTTNPDRVANRDELIPLLQELLEREDTDTWMKRFGEAGVPCAPILKLDQAFRQPQLEVNGMLHTVVHPTYGDLPVFGNPVRLAKSSPSIRTAPPRLGEHTFEVLEDRLGLDMATLHSLHAGGVISDLSAD